MAYITADDITGRLGQTFTIPASYLLEGGAALSVCISRVSELIDAYTGRHWESVTRSLLLDGDGTDMLSILPITGWPMSSVTSVTERDGYEDDFDVDGTVIESTLWTLHTSQRHIRRVDGGTWAVGIKNYKVVATFGASTIPEAVKQAAILLAREEMEPGHIDSWLPLYQEHFPDGYSYIRRMDTQQYTAPPATGRITTGNILVDGILLPYRQSIPFSFMGV